jgi:hypothetical protein
LVVVTCSLAGAHDQTKAARASASPAGVFQFKTPFKDLTQGDPVRHCHGEIHLEELSGKAHPGNAHERRRW